MSMSHGFAPWDSGPLNERVSGEVAVAEGRHSHACGFRRAPTREGEQPIPVPRLDLCDGLAAQVDAVAIVFVEAGDQVAVARVRGKGIEVGAEAADEGVVAGAALHHIGIGRVSRQYARLAKFMGGGIDSMKTD